MKTVNFWDRFPDDRLLTEASLWSADFTRLGEEIKRIDAYVDLFHIDVSDAHFVPSLLFFPDLVAALRPLTKKPFHIHLMTENPLTLVDDFADAGADIITVHCENATRVPAVLEKIASRGLPAGLALGLDVPVETLAPNLSAISVIVVMGTPMGVKGRDLSTLAPQRIRAARALLKEHGAEKTVRVESDGGIRVSTVRDLRAAGAQLIVMGSLAFKNNDLAGTMRWVRSL
jgi:ribulose-phosphate 3-epimerase